MPQDQSGNDDANKRKRTTPKPKPTTDQVKTAAYDATFHHVTRQENESAIREQGLLTNRGGRGGAGDALVVATRGAKAAKARRLNELSENKVHVSKGDDLEEYYQELHQKGGHTPATVSAYLPKGRLEGPSRDVEADPHDSRTTNHPNGSMIPAAYRTSNNIPPESIVPRHLELTGPDALRPSGTIGVDFAPRVPLDAVRSHLPPQFAGRSDRGLTEDARRAAHPHTDGRSVYPGSSSEDEQRPVKQPRRRADNPLPPDKARSYSSPASAPTPGPGGPKR